MKTSDASGAAASRPADTGAASGRPAEANTATVSNFIRQAIDADLASQKLAGRTWAGKPGTADVQRAGQADPARIRTRCMAKVSNWTPMAASKRETASTSPISPAWMRSSSSMLEGRRAAICTATRRTIFP